MRMQPLFSALILSVLTTAASQAQVNVALGKPVSLINPAEFGTGSGYFGGGTGGYTLPSPAIVTDGIFQAGYWATGIWWDEQHSGAHSYVVVDLQSLYTIHALSVMVDENDRYLLEYRNAQSAWVTAWEIPEHFEGGLSYRGIQLAAPIAANALRLSAIHDFSPGHDYAYAVSEIQAIAVPEPAQGLLLALGLPLLLAKRRFSAWAPPSQTSPPADRGTARSSCRPALPSAR